jgi:hypothetical protein
MKMGMVFGAVSLAFLAGAGCSSGNNSPPKGALAETFKSPPAAVHDAAKRALTDLSCTIETDSPTHLIARFQAGEVVNLTLRQNEHGETELWVATHITFVGGAWQKDRANDVVWAIKKELRDSVPSP